MDPRDRVVIVTGASMGIGEAVARAYAREGARVVLAARSFDLVEKLAGELGPDRALPVRADLRDRAQADAVIAQAVARFGRLDILVNNAGVGLHASLVDTDPNDCQAMFTLNVFAPLWLAQAAVPQMKKQAGGQIINVASVAGRMAFPWIGAYCATKYALDALTTTLRMELRRSNIHVIGIYPGPVKTPFSQNVYGDRRPESVLRPRGVSAEAVARAVLRASRHNRRSVMVPASLRLLIAFHRVLPGLTDRLLARFMLR